MDEILCKRNKARTYLYNNLFEHPFGGYGCPFTCVKWNDPPHNYPTTRTIYCTYLESIQVYTQCVACLPRLYIHHIIQAKCRVNIPYMDPIPDAQCIAYLLPFTTQNYPNVGKIPAPGSHGIYIHMGVSKNRGTPKWMVFNGKPY